MRVLVTGITGFAGGHLAEALLARGQSDLFGISRNGVWPADLLHLSTRVKLHACDLEDASSIEKILRDVLPERIFHLAGYADVGQSFQDVAGAWAGNLTATRNLYDAIVHWEGRPKILYVSSGLIYGDPVSQGHAFNEECPLRPASPYATSKAAADLLGFQCTRFPGLDIIRVRPFNHFGPRQGTKFAMAHFAQQIAAIERGNQAPILETGNLNAVRDLTDVRDMVEAYILLMEKGQSGEAYNASKGDAYQIGYVLERLLALARVPIQVRQKTSLMRASESPALQGDSTKLRRVTGWNPRFQLDQTLESTLEYWRSLPALPS